MAAYGHRTLVAAGANWVRLACQEFCRPANEMSEAAGKPPLTTPATGSGTRRSLPPRGRHRRLQWLFFDQKQSHKGDRQRAGCDQENH